MVLLVEVPDLRHAVVESKVDDPISRFLHCVSWILKIPIQLVKMPNLSGSHIWLGHGSFYHLILATTRCFQLYPYSIKEEVANVNRLFYRGKGFKGTH